MLSEKMIYIRVLTVCFHLYEFLKQVKLICGGKKNQNSICLWSCEDEGRNMREFAGLMGIFCILIRICVTQMYPLVKNHWMVYLRYVHFVVCKFYLTEKKLKNIAKYRTLVNAMHTKMYRGKVYICLKFTLKHIRE